MLLSALAPPGAPKPEDLLKFYSIKEAINYAMVQNGVIVNIIDWDGITPYTPPEGCELHKLESFADIGWSWVDGVPVDPNPLPSSSEPVAPSTDGALVVP